jgi:Xaa-Pro aminopeptidase
VVIAGSSREPDLAPFAGDAHLGESFLIARCGDAEPPHLGFLTAMERQEAAATGCRLLPPSLLGLSELIDQGLSPAERWPELLRRGLEAAAVDKGRIAVAGRLPAGVVIAAAGALAAAGWELVDGSGLALQLRKRKTDDEVSEVRRVAAATVAAFARVAELLSATVTRASELWLEGERLTAGRLRGELSTVLARYELEQPEGNIVAAGADSSVPHTRGASERVLRAGESMIVDLFPRGRLFADCTRTFCVGEPPPALARAHEVVSAALAAAHRRAGDGVGGWSLQVEACDRFEAAGYATARSDPETVQGYVHGLGHGVGYELHELPSFRRAAEEGEGRLQEGDLFTLEPGLYDPTAGWGVRLEDLCWLGPSGPENLTPAPYPLDPRAWSG